MLRDLLDLLRAWRAGRLGPRPERSRGGDSGPRQSAYGRLYEVTAVGGGTCTVQRPKAGGGLDADSELTDVAYDADSAPAVGDRGEVLRLAEGNLYFHPGGGTGTPGLPVMIKAKANMAADNVAYGCVYLSAAGAEGAGLTARRPPGQLIRAYEVGYLGQDSAGVAMFVPCHARRDIGTELYLEVRTSEPANPEAGRIWWRSDL